MLAFSKLTYRATWLTFYIYSSCTFIFQENAKLLNFGYDDVIIHEGDPPGGIYIIVSGMVRVSFKAGSEKSYSILFKRVI